MSVERILALSRASSSQAKALQSVFNSPLIQAIYAARNRVWGDYSTSREPIDYQVATQLVSLALNSDVPVRAVFNCLARFRSFPASQQPMDDCGQWVNFAVEDARYKLNKGVKTPLAREVIVMALATSLVRDDLYNSDNYDSLMRRVEGYLAAPVEEDGLSVACAL